MTTYVTTIKNRKAVFTDDYIHLNGYSENDMW